MDFRRNVRIFVSSLFVCAGLLGAHAALADGCFTSSCGPAVVATVSVWANPTSSYAGNPVVVSWNAAFVNPGTCSANYAYTPGPEDTTGIGTVITSGSGTVYPAVTTTYTVSCYDPYGDPTPGNYRPPGWISASVTVPVTPMCTSSANACGQTQTGACPQSPPPNPAGYGSACSSAANACGQTNSGTIQCNGSCSATTPANPAGYGNACNSTPNSCGQTGAGTIQCNGSCSGITPPNSSCPAPDLTAGATSFTAQSGSPWVWAGTSFTFAAPVSNVGNATATNFPNTFWIENVALFGANALSLGGGGGGTMSGAYTFSAPGSYNVRGCADMNTSWGGTVAESNEGNNCGPWYGFEVVPAMPTNLSATCNADGTGVTLSWNPSSGSSFYYLRVSRSASAPFCPAGWADVGWGCTPSPDSVSGTSKVLSAVPGEAKSWWVHGALASGAWGPAGNGTYTCNGASDLTATNLVPAGGSSHTAGSSINFQGRINNLGNAAASNVPNVLQIESNGLIAAAPTPASIAAGGNTTVSASYTFPNSGSFPRTERYRFCADNNTSWVGTNTESNEGNNCAAWTSITLNTLPTTASLSCTPASCTVPVGNTVTLNYVCGNSTSATLSTFGSVPVPSGARTAGTAGPYTLSCTGPGGTANDSETVTFTTPTVTITASNERVNPGGSSTISWSSSPEVSDCTITRDGAAFANGANGSNVPATNIVHPAVFSASCTSGGIPGAATDSVIVNTTLEIEEF